MDDNDEVTESLKTYRKIEDINSNELQEAMLSLSLMNSDWALRSQIFTLSIVDQFIMKLEQQCLLKFQKEETSIFSEMLLLAGLSQMWIFAAYEIMRTWREKAKDIKTLAANGGLKLKIEALSKELGYRHPRRDSWREELQSFEEDKTKLKTLDEDLAIIHMVFAQLQHIRVTLAKHHAPGKQKLPALDPGYSRINLHCGSLDFEMERGKDILGVINRRDIADALRAIVAREIPKEEDIASFDAYMRLGAGPEEF